MIDSSRHHILFLMATMTGMEKWFLPEWLDLYEKQQTNLLSGF